MKVVNFIFFLSLTSINTYANIMDAKTITSKIDEVTIFFQGAELVHTANTNLQKGFSEVWITGLSPNIDRNSLKIKTTNAVIVSSFEFSVDYLTEKTLSASTQKLQDAVKVQQKLLDQVQTEIKINTNLLNILQKSTEKNASGSDKGLSIDDLMKMMDYYKSKAGELEKSIADSKEKEAETRRHLNELKAQLDQETAKNSNKTSGVLKLNLTSPVDGTCDFTVSYYTGAASWTPYYDVNVAAPNQPVKITSKAKVRQLTGVDWEKVRITLSTAVPSAGKIAPLFNTWFLQFMENIQVRGAGVSSSRKMMMQNSFSYEMAAKNMEVEEMDEIEFDAPTSMDDYVTQSENQLNLTFNIDLPYSIPGNGKEQAIELKNQEIAATFKYYCAPKLDAETYLLAEIADWEKLNLLSGSANITYDGTYVGETYIDANSTHQNLTLTLGTDRRIAVKREKMKEFSSTGFLGNDVKQEFAYLLTVRNNRNETARMALKDQYPISTTKEITVELSKDTTPPTANIIDLGVVTWEYDMQPGETRTFKLIYTVKYPKGRTLNL